jgi:5-(carboxyamino)imidazole ribonucleotide synthase
VILKACEDSYDGRGNFIINEEADIENGLEFFHGRLCMVEKFVPFTKEISVMVARNTLGQIESFPVVENIHAHGILTRTIAPARISKESSDKAVQIAKKLVKILNGAGIYGIEMFLKENGDILINEIAPRPHNSVHYSIDACSVSQFEQHIRAILGLPLTQPRLLSAAVMVNILGPDNFTGQYSICGFKQAANIQGLKLHIYGKDTSKPRRKLAHFTITAGSVEEALGKADLAGKALIVEEFKNDKKFGEADSWNRNGK